MQSLFIIAVRMVEGLEPCSLILVLVRDLLSWLTSSP